MLFVRMPPFDVRKQTGCGLPSILKLHKCPVYIYISCFTNYLAATHNLKDFAHQQ